MQATHRFSGASRAALAVDVSTFVICNLEGVKIIEKEKK
jgi:hypothetical protein